MGSGTHCSKIDGFPGTHANGATVVLLKVSLGHVVEESNSTNWQMKSLLCVIEIQLFINVEYML